jgi:hypothetical protein
VRQGDQSPDRPARSEESRGSENASLAATTAQAIIQMLETINGPLPSHHAPAASVESC